VSPPTNSPSRVSASTDPIVIVALGGGFIAGALFVSLALSLASPAVLKYLTHVADTLSPFAPFFTVLAAGIGWYAAALFNGQQARQTEREKRDATNEAVRGLVRARLKRILEVIREAVNSEKPYIDYFHSINYFLEEIQKIYWNVDTFAAFWPAEHDLILEALDDCRLDNQIATRIVNNSESWDHGNCFQRSLAALGPVFRKVFRDEKLEELVQRVAGANTARTKTRD
jgi:hypothetical protein